MSIFTVNRTLGVRFRPSPPNLNASASWFYQSRVSQRTPKRTPKLLREPNRASARQHARSTVTLTGTLFVGLQEVYEGKISSDPTRHSGKHPLLRRHRNRQAHQSSNQRSRRGQGDYRSEKSSAPQPPPESSTRPDVSGGKRFRRRDSH